MELICASSFLNIQNYYDKKYDWKLVNNFIALFHASTCFILGFMHLFYIRNENIKFLFIKNSIGYFLYDICCVIEKRKINSVSIFYLYHHIVTINFLNLQEDIYNTILFIFLNKLQIFLHILYYCIKTNNSYLKKAKYIQFLFYTFVRLPIITYFLFSTIFENHNNISYLNILSLLPIYIMGFIWSKSLYLNLNKI